MHKTRVAIIGPPALSRLIEYVFRGHDEFEITGRLTRPRNLDVQAERLRPELIIAHVHPIRVGIGAAVRKIKRSSPGAKLIFICSVSGLVRHVRECGADSCMMQEALVARLLPTAQALLRSRVLPRSPGRRWHPGLHTQKSSRRSS